MDYKKGQLEAIIFYKVNITPMENILVIPLLIEN